MVKKPSHNNLSKYLLISASLFNAFWLLGIILNPSISFLSNYASFYASRCEPFAWFFHFIDFGFFVSLTLWGIINFKRYSKYLTVSCIVLGVSTFGDSLFPPACLHGGTQDTGILSELTHVHAYTSSISYLALVICVAIIAYKLVQQKWRRGFTITLAAITLFLLAQYNYHIFFSGSSFVGLVQRAIIALFSVWLLLIFKIDYKDTNAET